MNDFDIALVGIACRFPDAQNKNEYWNNLKKGVDSISVLSEEELIRSGIKKELFRRDNYVKSASFIKDYDCFDANYFNFSPNEAAMLDPQHRIFLELAVEALEDAGISPEKSNDIIGVFAGASYNTYLINNIVRGRRFANPDDLFSIQISNDKDNLATRIAYKLDLKGPSLNVQTSCSSSLVALHYAIQSLLNYDCDVALAGAISVRVPIEGYLYQENLIASKDGKCRPFDKDASGTVFGSGGGIVVVKRAKDAIRDKDNIVCIIKGSAVNNDGSEKVGYTAPCCKGQQDVIKQAIDVSGVGISTISAIETHGTGTVLGDPIEFEALNNVFSEEYNVNRKCALGSVKSNIGHLENASGIAGLIKMALCLKNRYLVPSLHFNEINPLIDIENSPFYINTDYKHWESDDDIPLRCGVSSFGIGGTNAHVILEEFQQPFDEIIINKTYSILPISGASRFSTEQQVKNILQHIERENSRTVEDVAYTLCMGRNECKYKQILVLDNAKTDIKSDKYYTFTNFNKTDFSSKNIVFLFPGQGSQYLNMAKELYENEPIFRNEINVCAELLLKKDIDILSILYPEKHSNQDIYNLINSTNYTQPLLFSVEYALSKLLIALGVKPNTFIGHSLGEYVAAYFAGAFSLEDALNLVAERGRLISKLDEGDMCVIYSSKERIESILPENISIAAINSSNLLVISGNKDDIGLFCQKLTNENLTHKILHTSHAFHSKMMDAILNEFTTYASSIKMNPIDKSFISNLTGEWNKEGDILDATYWTKHIRQTVLFRQGIDTIIKSVDDDVLFIEVGPGNTLTSFIKSIDPSQMVATSLPHAKEETRADFHFATLIGKLWCLNISLNWQTYYGDTTRRKVQLPAYPFEKNKYWINPVEINSTDNTGLNYHNQYQSKPLGENDMIENLTLTQRKVQQIYSTVLGGGNIALTDSFFELGGHSLLATKTIPLINNAFDIKIKLQDFLKRPTIKEFSSFIDSETNKNRNINNTELPLLLKDEANLFEPFPLTEMQQAQWLGRIGSFTMGDVAAHVYFEVDKKGLDIERIDASWQKMIDRHDMLRTILLKDGTQKVLKEPLIYKIKVNDLRNENDALKKGLLIRKSMDHIVRPVDKWPLFEIQCSLLPDNNVKIHFSIDLLICDVASLRILMKEWANYYESPTFSPPPLDLHFRDYVIAENKLRETDLYVNASKYWDSKIKYLPERPDLPIKNTNTQSSKYSRISTKLNTEKWEEIKKIGNKHNLSPSMVLLTAFSEILGIWSKNKSFCVNTTIINRLPIHEQVFDIIGEFATFAPVTVNINDTKTFLDLAKELQDDNWENLENRYLHGTSILRKMAKLKGETLGSVLPVVFTSTLVHKEEGEENFHKQFGSYTYVISQTPQVWLDHAVFEEADGVLLSWHFVENLFEDDIIEQMFSAYQTLLQKICDDEKFWEHKYPDFLPLFNDKKDCEIQDKKIPNRLLHESFVKNSISYPNNEAIVFENGSITYNELNIYSDCLAENIELVQKEQESKLIAIIMDKGWEQVVAVLGILKAGYAYLPILADTPHERILYILKDADIRVVITQSRHINSISYPQNISVVEVKTEKVCQLAKPFYAKRQVAPTDLAYVIYTSGSTGQPKGVMISHQAALNTIEDISKRFRVNDSDRIFALSELSFDLSVYDILGALSVGATIVLPSETMSRDPEAWHKMICNHNVTVWNSVPALMEMYVEYLSGYKSEFNNLRLVMLSGDWIPVSLPDKIKMLSTTNCQVISLGGATEASIWSIFYPIEDIDPNWKSIPYGKALSNQKMYVLDENLQPCPPMVTGHIYIGGVGVADGYLNNMELTKTAFILNRSNNERLYNTGDLGRLLWDGNIEFLGREDSQVKIGGFRIEIGEIESHLLSLEGVKNAIVVLNESKKLLSFVQPHNDSTSLCTRVITENLHLSLPHYMIPSEIYVVDEFPLTSNGKIDRKTLASSSFISTLSQIDNKETQSSEENINNEKYNDLIEVFADILRVPTQQIDINQNFFSMGGDSILGIKIISKLKERGIELSPRMIFEYPTIKELSQLCSPIHHQETNIQLSFFQKAILWNNHDNIEKTNDIFLFKLKKKINPQLIDKAYSEIAPLFESFHLKGSVSEKGGHLEFEEVKSFEIDYMDNIPLGNDLDKFISDVTNEILLQQHNIGTPPLVRMCILENNFEEYLLLISNKFILDFYAVDLFIKLLFDHINQDINLELLKEQIYPLTKNKNSKKGNNNVPRIVSKVNYHSLNIEIEKNYSERMELLELSHRIRVVDVLAIIGLSYLKHTKYHFDENIFIRYMLPSIYDDFSHNRRVVTCGSFYKTFQSQLNRSLMEQELNLKKMSLLLKETSFDVTELAVTDIEDPSIDILYYGDINSNDILDVKSFEQEEVALSSSPCIIIIYKIDGIIHLRFQTSIQDKINLSSFLKDRLKTEIDDVFGISTLDKNDFDTLNISDEEFHKLLEQINDIK